MVSTAQAHTIPATTSVPVCYSQGRAHAQHELQMTLTRCRTHIHPKRISTLISIFTHTNHRASIAIRSTESTLRRVADALGYILRHIQTQLGSSSSRACEPEIRLHLGLMPSSSPATTHTSDPRCLLPRLAYASYPLAQHLSPLSARPFVHPSFIRPYHPPSRPAAHMPFVHFALIANTQSEGVGEDGTRDGDARPHSICVGRERHESRCRYDVRYTVVWVSVVSSLYHCPVSTLQSTIVSRLFFSPAIISFRPQRSLAIFLLGSFHIQSSPL